MRKSKQVLGIILTALLFFPIYAASQTPYGIERWWEDSEIIQKLQFSEMQIRNFKMIYEEGLKNLVDLTATFERDRGKLIAMKKAGIGDEDEFLTLMDRVDESYKEIDIVKAAMMDSIKNHMTEEQQKRFEENQKLREASRNFIALLKPYPVTSDPGTKKIVLPSGEEAYLSGEGIQGPFIIDRTISPSYTYEARRRRIQGLVVLRAVVCKDGSVGDVEVLQSPGYGLGGSAIETIQEKWRFAPAKRNGQFVNALIDIEVSFRVNRK